MGWCFIGLPLQLVTGSHYCASRFNVTPIFVDYSLLVILIEKEITEMNLDIDRIIRHIFLKYIGWD